MTQWHHQGTTKRSIRWCQKVKIAKDSDLTSLSYFQAFENSMSGPFPAEPTKGPLAMQPAPKVNLKSTSSLVGPTQSFFMRESKALGVRLFLHSTLGRCSGLQTLMLQAVDRIQSAFYRQV